LNEGKTEGAQKDQQTTGGKRRNSRIRGGSAVHVERKENRTSAKIEHIKKIEMCGGSSSRPWRGKESSLALRKQRPEQKNSGAELTEKTNKINKDSLKKNSYRLGGAKLCTTPGGRSRARRLTERLHQEGGGNLRKGSINPINKYNRNQLLAGEASRSNWGYLEYGGTGGYSKGKSSRASATRGRGGNASPSQKKDKLGNFTTIGGRREECYWKVESPNRGGRSRGAAHRLHRAGI